MLLSLRNHILPLALIVACSVVADDIIPPADLVAPPGVCPDISDKDAEIAALNKTLLETRSLLRKANMKLLTFLKNESHFQVCIRISI